MKAIDLVSLDFDRIKALPDKRVIAEFELFSRSSSKPVFPKSLRWDAYKLTRSANKITVHLLFETKEVGRFSFVPGPNFS